MNRVRTLSSVFFFFFGGGGVGVVLSRFRGTEY